MSGLFTTGWEAWVKPHHGSGHVSERVAWRYVATTHLTSIVPLAGYRAIIARCSLSMGVWALSRACVSAECGSAIRKNILSLGVIPESKFVAPLFHKSRKHSHRFGPLWVRRFPNLSWAAATTRLRQAIWTCG